MLVCPDCGAENLEGVDACDQCSGPMTDLFIRVPKTSVEADLLKDTVDVIPTHPPVIALPTATVEEVLNLMTGSSIGCVLIVENEQLAGVFTERDALIRLNCDAERYADQPISRFMTPNPAVLEAHAKIAFALHKMNVGGYRHLPLLDDGVPVSVISIRDILRYLKAHSPQPTV